MSEPFSYFAPATSGPPAGPTGLCPRCAQPLAVGYPFCTRCGTPIAAAAGHVPAQAPYPGQQFGAPYLRQPPTGAAPYGPPPGRAAVTLTWGDLLPLRTWWQSAAWRQGWLGMFLACALTPFVLLQATGRDTDVRHAAWGFTIYFAVIWLIAIRALIRPQNLSVGRLAWVIGMTAVIGVSMAITIERHLNADTSTLLHSILTVGFPEEIAKALPLLLVLVSARDRLTPRTYLYLGAVSGLTFGAVESVAYTALYSNGIEQTGDSGYVTGIIWRLLTDSLFHAAMAGIVGVFIGFAAMAHRQRLLLVAAGLTVAATLHGAYDRTAGHWAGVLVAAIVIFVFAGYIHSSDDIAQLTTPQE